jgi:hypothetical protein
VHQFSIRTVGHFSGFKVKIFLVCILLKLLIWKTKKYFLDTFLHQSKKMYKKLHKKKKKPLPNQKSVYKMNMFFIDFLWD